MDSSNHCCYLDLEVSCLQTDRIVLFWTADHRDDNALSFLHTDTRCAVPVEYRHADLVNSLAERYVLVIYMSVAVDDRC